MPQSTAPLTFFLERTATRINARNVTRIGATPTPATGTSWDTPFASVMETKLVAENQCTLPESRLSEASLTFVDPSKTTMPAFYRPINAINKPIPAGIAILTQSGIAAKIFFLKPVTVKSTNTTPSIRINSNALA